MAKNKTTHVVYIHETFRESAARDITTAAVFLGLWSVGHFAQSAALEWVGVIVAFIIITVRGADLVRGVTDKRMTPEQARVWLDEKFPTPTPDGQETE